ncbi:complement C1q and tumor necrosis factor-related protein 9 [Osmerus mordax]|uniref:complement C1q and tumor necrosis factor-related protein 9 n=1 Tax=Osmerus mordax TaxID=8014 RepID=UPI00350EE923
MATSSTGLAMKTLLGLLLGLSLSSAQVLPELIDHEGMFNGSMMYQPGLDSNADATYCQMLLDSPVPPPADQVPWFCICSRCKGTLGPKGDRGDRGLPGRPGSPGIRGLTGFRGRPGFTGRPGIKGEKGDEGLKGDKGPLGFSGAKGDVGFKGEKGETGLDGPAGGQGPKGDEGQCPQACDVAQGPPGLPGLPGPAGARGLPGVAGPTGSMGPKGDSGVPGVPGGSGRAGQKGDQGPEGNCNCTDGAKGATGLQGLQGAKGDQGQVGPQGIPGSRGLKGDDGIMGMMGMPGPCAPLVQSAFSVGLSTLFPNPNTPVVFSFVHYNRQMHYDPQSGLYTAPVNGTYIFSYHLTVFGRVLKVGLFHNFLPVVKTTNTADLGTASQQVVLHLSRGDRVWIQVKDSTTNGMYASSEASSTFSGFLLNADSCDMPMGRDFPVPMAKGQYTWGEMPGPTPTPTP